MYIPRLFRQSEPDMLDEIMRQYSFATLVTSNQGIPFASHLPFLLDPASGDQGTILGHMARANPQWKDFDSAQEVLVIYQGPHAYISPSWYEGQLHVPTWNYAAVHAYGIPQIIDDRAEFHALLKSTVDTYEADFEKPWPFDLPEEFVNDLMKAIVGFRIRITRIEGKQKLSQNRDDVDQRSVIEKLAASADPNAQQVAAWMQRIHK